MVYVLNVHKQPLMPCSEVKAKRLLDQKKAKVLKRTPFTIILLYGSAGYKQDVVLGVDAGSKTVGISAVSEDKELYAAEMSPRNDVVKNLATRRENRRTRRNRKTRYRKPRFDNRVRSKHKGWLAPSVEVKIQEHISVIKQICRLLPITKVVIETAEFDLQKIKAMEDGKPLPQGKDYQRGELLGHYNVRQYVLFRDGYTCLCCGAHGEGIKLHVHHLESRKIGGNAPDVFVTICDVCHEAYHQDQLEEEISKKLSKRKRRSTRDAAFMGIMRKTLMTRLHNELDVPVYETHGYITKYTRVELLDLPKTHVNDALAIALGPNTETAKITRINRINKILPVRHHNRCLHKSTILKGGIRKFNQAKKYVQGFRLFDKVLYQGKECFVWGRRTSGYFLLKTLDGKKVKDGVHPKHLKLLERSSTYLIA